MKRWFRLAAHPDRRHLGLDFDKQGEDRPSMRRQGELQSGTLNGHFPGSTEILPSRTVGAAIVLLTLVIALITAFVR